MIRAGRKRMLKYKDRKVIERELYRKEGKEEKDNY
jgi:hypothetical protein